MRSSFESINWQDAAIILVISALSFVLYPFFMGWLHGTLPWYLIYLLWALLILIGFILERRFRNHDV